MRLRRNKNGTNALHWHRSSFLYPTMGMVQRQRVSFESLEEPLQGELFLPEGVGRAPAVVLCHGAGDFKENYFELAEYLTERGIASLALDMHGHGESGGPRYHVEMREWVADVRAALDYLCGHTRIDPANIGAFGPSSGGTAILEAALVDSRVKALVLLDATVRDSLPVAMSLSLKFLTLVGRMKRQITSQDLHLPLMKLSGGLELASDPQVNARLLSNERALEAFNAFPLPGAAQAFFVDTIKRASQVRVPTLVLWGEDDKLDSPETARLLYSELTCKKQLHIIPGNGHAGHMDRHREKVFALTCEWLLENLTGDDTPVDEQRRAATQT
jgi:alpha-beta hydrolase superfamily lysophospholipase